MKKTALVLLLIVIITASGMAAGRSVIDFESFLNRHDMLWDRIPNRWEVAPYTGNGNMARRQVGPWEEIN